jgi:Fur family ferric uptake transcriptional regulator
VGENQHAHLVCRNCGEVGEIEPDMLAPLADDLARKRGFSLDIGHVALFGTCGKCGEQG